MPSLDFAKNQRPFQYFNFAYQEPDAIVILNRGTPFEQDITNNVIAFNTSNDIESIVGNFTCTVDNTNDIYVNRFGYTYIKKMSSIEVFAKSLKGSDVTSTSPMTNFDSIPIPQSMENLNAVVEANFGSSTESEKADIRSQIIKLNEGRVAPKTFYTINKVQTVQDASNKVSTITVNPTATEVVITKFDNSKINIPITSLETNNQSVVTFSVGDNESTIKILNSLNYVSKTALPKNSKILSSDFSLTTDPKDKARMEEIRLSPLRIPRPSNLYKRIFQGIILNITQNISPGAGLSLTLNGKTNGYWMEATSVNLFPGGFEVTFNNVDLSVFANRYAQNHAMDIFRDLIRFSTDDLVTVTDFNIDTTDTSQEWLELNGKFEEGMEDVNGNPIPTVDAQGNPTGLLAKYKDTFPSAKLKQLENQRERLYEGFPFDADPNLTVTSVKVTKNQQWTDFASQYVAAKKAVTAAEKGIDTTNRNNRIKLANARATGKQSEVDKALRQAGLDTEAANKKLAEAEKVQDNLRSQMDKNIDALRKDKEAIDRNLDTTRQELNGLVKAGRERVLKQFGIIDHWKKIFARNVLEVVDNRNFLNLVYPFRWDIRSPGADMDGDYISKADLANMVKEKIMYEFYVDTNGHYVLKPPLYNIQPDQTSDTYVIKEEDVVSVSVNDTVDGIITRIGVVGDWVEAPGLEKIMLYNIFSDFNLIRDYGFHAKEIANRTFLRNIQDCRDFGKAYMTKNNMELFNASVTIIGNPNLRLGMSIYFQPRDTIYYIKGISHELTVGGQFQTTLTLIGGRRIVTGFAAKLATSEIKKFVTQKDPQTGKPKETFDAEAGEIEHYILSNNVSNFNMTDDQFTFANTPLSRDSSFTAKQITALNDELGTVDGEPAVSPTTGKLNPNLQNPTLSKNTPIILRNVFQITHHQNPTYVGLIVKKDAAAATDINVANFNYLISLNEKNLSNSFQDLSVSPLLQPAAIEIIRREFIEFGKTNGFIAQGETNSLLKVLTPETAVKNGLAQPKLFTGEYKDNFILSFLKNVSDILNIDDTNRTSGDRNTGISNIKNEYSAASIIFNIVIRDLDNNGIYRQFTDADGREMPAYLDYGRSLIIQNAAISVSDFAAVNAATESQRNEAEQARRSAVKAAEINPRGVSKNTKISLMELRGQLNNLGVSLDSQGFPIQPNNITDAKDSTKIKGDT